MLLVCIPEATLAGPNLAGSFADPPYALAAHCDLAQPIAFVNLLVVNRGDARTAAIPVTATDGAGVLRGSTTLLPIPPGAQSALLVPLLDMPSNPGALGGTHTITISLGAFHLAPVAVTVPPTFCATQAPGAATGGVSRSAAERAAHLPLAVTPGPLIGVTKPSSNVARITAEKSTPAAPGQMYIPNSAKQCAWHVGVLGAFACPDLIRSGDVLLVWDWEPGSIGPRDIDGFRVYRVDGHMKKLVYTRANKKDITLYDLPGPSGTHIGQCYAVAAYAGSFESALSGMACLTRQNTISLAQPSVVPTPSPTPVPRHVVIHITEDSFPTDTVVAAGGDVTWINDDTDAHTVEFDGGNYGRELAPGGRYTHTFPDKGVNYVANYLCRYHMSMNGRLTVLH
ncbi:MAG: Cupredoxin-like domain [Candidatus Eremiobacteraeota bacterium]|nr:Cupredoxin-like domain [Candidatus Eremiobacteraeota bacterium]